MEQTIKIERIKIDRGDGFNYRVKLGQRSNVAIGDTVTDENGQSRTVLGVKEVIMFTHLMLSEAA